MSSGSVPSLSRRTFLRRSLDAGAGAVFGPALCRLAAPSLLTAGAGLLAACSSTPTAPTVVPLFSPDRVLVAGRPQRIPFAIVSPDPSLGETDVALPPDGGEVGVVIRRDGEVVAETAVAGRVVDHDHVGEPDPDHQHANLFRYYPLRAELAQPGIFDLTVMIEGTETELAIQLFDPAEAELPLVGDPFPSIISPTVDRPGDVDRLCTRVVPCDFHATSVDEVVGTGRAAAVLVATPAFCSTAYCGPVLDTLIAESGAHPDIEFIHIEVYANPDEVDGNYLDPRIRLAPAVAALGLGFEPSLFLVAGDGTLADRIDNVFDRTELAEVLATL